MTMPKSNSTKLKAVRCGHRSTIARLLSQIEDAKQNVVLFNASLQTLEVKSKTLESLNEKILDATEPEDVESEIVEADIYTLDLEVQLRELRNYQQRMDHPREPNGDPQITANPCETTGQSSSQNQTVSNVSITSNSSHHKLPKLSLPSFDGDILQWQTFWDSFESTVHNNSNLTDIQRFSYLMNQLEGEAARTIEGFTLTNNNYCRALSLLKERFGQEHKIIHATMQALLNLPCPKDEIYSLRNFHDKMEAYIRSLDSLKQTQESYGNLLVPIILDKLPTEVRKSLAREHGDNNWTLTELRDAIRREISILEAGHATKYSPSNMYETATFLTNTKSKGNNHNASKGNSNRPVRQCVFCSGTHGASDCNEMVDYESRIKVVKQKQLCYNCLGRHQVSNCHSNGRCKKCHKKHHTSICKPQQNQVTPSYQSNTSVYHSSMTSGVLLKTATATVRARNQDASANILFDEGSQRSFITQDLADKLQITSVGFERIHLSSFGNQENKTMNLKTTTIELQTDDRKVIPIQVLIVPTIANPIDISLVERVHKYKHLKGLKFAHVATDDEVFNVSMLIGADFYWQIVEDRVIRGNGPTAVKSKVGYLLSGPVPGQIQRQTNHIMNVITSHRLEEDAIERFWTLESMGITPENTDTHIDNPTKKYMESSISYESGKYVAMLPWKQEHEPLPTNYAITLKRTESTVKRLARQPEMLKTYGKIIEEQERRGFIERVPENVENANSKHIHYIPHHPVKKDSTTTPVRIVYDCSCRQTSNHASLNDCLESTPPQLNDITSLLIRFRLHKYAVTTDIEKAFLNITLHEQDRDATRFLWLEDPTDPMSAFTTYRFKSVLFGATCSPFILYATINKHLELNSNVKAAQVLSRDLYVDNILSSFDKEEDALTFYKESRELMRGAGMNLRSWASNNANVRTLAENEKVIDTDKMIKVLGMRWDPEGDVLSFSEKDTPTLDAITKRDILKLASSIYDPLGLLSPITVRAKILMQNTWKMKLDWDVNLPDEYLQTWNSIATDLQSILKTQFTRQMLPGYTIEPEHDSDCHLHIFVDASVKSYGATAYLSTANQSRLVIAKNRVAPVKELTLPRLELMAAVVGARLYKHIQSTLRVQNVTFWSDSQIVLHWLSSKKQLPVFVRNRVHEVHTMTDSCTWRYCPTNYNPADLLTRGITAAELQRSELWEQGPSWLRRKNDWPVWDVNLQPENKTSQSETHISPVASLQCLSDTVTVNLSNVIDIQNYSNYNKLLRITALVLRFVTNCRTEVDNRRFGHVSQNEINIAKMQLIKCVQQSTYPDVITDLKSGGSKRPIARQLRLYIDTDGLLRCGGRIHNAKLPETTRFPYLLPDRNHFTKLMVQATHERLLHSGVTTVVTNIRERYWVPAIRRCVNSVIKTCIACRKVVGKPYSAPDSPPLPKIRVEDTSPFKVTGVDFTGNLHVQNDSGIDIKAYICLFTCATTRAVHLEVVPDLSTQSFLQAFRRFTSRCSIPEVMVSDNATTFESAAQEIKRLYASSNVHKTLVAKGTEWRFIPKRAPWYGGWWERLIGMTKSALKKVLGRSYITYHTLQTIITEIEAILNDRPITYITSDISDPEPVTPSLLMYGRRMTSMPHNTLYTDHDLSKDRSKHRHIVKLAEHQQKLLDDAGRRWRREYLTSLREYHRAHGHNDQTISVGDVVQIHDDCPRTRWKLAVITGLVRGNDNLIRSAVIRTKDGVTNRPITKLYPLELMKNN